MAALVVLLGHSFLIFCNCTKPIPLHLFVSLLCLSLMYFVSLSNLFNFLSHTLSSSLSVSLSLCLSLSLSLCLCLCLSLSLSLSSQDDRHIMYYFSFSHVLLLLFALNDRSSFHKARQIRQKADAHWHGSRPISTVLVGCKGDTERQVSTSEALAVAKELDCCYVETSAAEGHNCALPFKTAVKMYSHLYTERFDLIDSGEHTHGKTTRGIIRKLLSPISLPGKRESRDLSLLRLPPARLAEVPLVSPLRTHHRTSIGHTPQTPEPITITVSMEG